MCGGGFVPQINPLYNAICFGTLLSALDKIGVSLPIVARQTSQLLEPLMSDYLRGLIGSNDLPKNLHEVKEVIEKLVSVGGIGETKVEVSDNTLTVSGNDCMYIDMARFGRSLGYNSCPLCVIALMLIALVSVPKIGVVSDTTVTNNGNECCIKITIED
ncbi:MAG: hypothetical protein QXN15_10730 [Candidatus Jordarchaeales archaeon]|nr:hypothetical protein [Candidatus Jordarchaeia archaeon]